MLGVGGIVHTAALAGCAPRESTPSATPTATAAAAGAPATAAASGNAAVPLEPFTFLQLSDTHWGYSGAANPEAATTLRQAVATINASAVPLDFVVFTGDLTPTRSSAAAA